MRTQHPRLGSNPFIRNRVTDYSPLDTDVDVPTAYKEQFEPILGGLDPIVIEELLWKDLAMHRDGKLHATSQDDDLILRHVPRKS